MNEEDAKKRITFLSCEIKANDSLYYQDDNPVLSDAEYDVLRQELIALETEFPHLITKDSPTPVSYTHLTLPTNYSV